MSSPGALRGTMLELHKGAADALESDFEFGFTMSLLLPLLIGLAGGIVIGLCAGWLARGRDEVVVEKVITQTVEKVIERTPDDLVRQRHQANQVLLQLQDLTSGVSARLDAHSRTVGTINEELNAAGPQNTEVVLNAIRHLVESNTVMQSQLELAQARLEQQAGLLQAQQEEALTDPLTRLRNRRALDEELSRRIQEHAAAGKRLVLMMLDVDHFKKCNDTYGHLAGDEVLRMVGRIISESSLDCDNLFGARFGGEEFAVLLTGESLEAASNLGDAIRRRLGELPVVFDGHRITITASGGIAEVAQGEEIPDLIARADEALYTAKRSGRNLCCLHDGTRIRKLATPERPVAPAYTTEVDSPDALHKGINRRIAEWRRGGVGLAMIVARIDNMAAIAGQQGLRGESVAMSIVTEFFKRTLREMDQLALLGGEFYGMMLPTAKIADAARIAERMRIAVRSGDLDDALGSSITMSFGVAEVSADDDGDSLLLRARRAMEAARRRGGDAVYVNDGVYSTLAAEVLEVELARAEEAAI